MRKKGRKTETKDKKKMALPVGFEPTTPWQVPYHCAMDGRQQKKVVIQ